MDRTKTTIPKESTENFEDSQNDEERESKYHLEYRKYSTISKEFTQAGKSLNSWANNISFALSGASFAFILTVLTINPRPELLRIAACMFALSIPLLLGSSVYSSLDQQIKRWRGKNEKDFIVPMIVNGSLCMGIGLFVMGMYITLYTLSIVTAYFFGVISGFFLLIYFIIGLISFVKLHKNSPDNLTDSFEE